MASFIYIIKQFIGGGVDSFNIKLWISPYEKLETPIIEYSGAKGKLIQE